MTGAPPGTIGRAANRYAGAGRFTRHYVAAKLRTDPLYADLLSLDEHLGQVVDVGCGCGQLGALLLEAGLAERVTGLDWNRAHVAGAESALAGLPFVPCVQDLAADQTVPDGDTVMIIDVLYQLATEVQHRLLDSATRAARSQLLIRTLDRGRGARSAFATAAERLGQRFWPNSGAHVNPLSVSATVARLADAGFTVEITPSWRGTPFANVLLRARRVGLAS